MYMYMYICACQTRSHFFLNYLLSQICKTTCHDENGRWNCIH